MRARTLMATVAVAIGLTPSLARANGGAYIDFDGTHHLPGEQVTGEVYVSIPRDHRDLLDRGPFYAYLLTGRAFIEEGRPLPDGAIRLGTFVVHEDGEDTELTVSFTVPGVAGDFYQVGMCNDPCTVSGFGETVSGTVSVVATAREASLLTGNGRLRAQLSDVKRDLKKAEKVAEDRASLAAADLAESEAARASLAGQVEALGSQVTRAREEAVRPSIGPWSAAALAVALLVLAAVLAGRRRRPVPDGRIEDEPVTEGV